MGRFLRILAIVIVVLGLLVGSGAAIIVVGWPRVGPVVAVNAPATPEAVARGRYLVEHVAACFSCHGSRDPDIFGEPLIPGTEGAGGQGFTRAEGIPGVIYASDITPSAIGSWSDGGLLRTLTTGVTPDGTALFPLMPYGAYGRLSRRDVLAIIAYLRTLPPIVHPIPPRHLDFPMNIIVHVLPKPAHCPEHAPPRSDRLAYGKYLVDAAACIHCHSLDHHGTLVPGMEFAGGVPFQVPGGVVRSANITPDPETGIGRWTQAAFVARFRDFPQTPGMARPVKAGRGAGQHLPPGIPPLAYNTPMPWSAYGRMTPEDLAAIWTYLRQVPAVRNPTVRFTPR